MGKVRLWEALLKKRRVLGQMEEYYNRKYKCDYSSIFVQKIS